MKCLILSEFSQVRKASDVLQKFAHASGLDENLRGQVELILVESLNNIIEHSYQGKGGHPIHVEISQVADEVIITLKDEGLAVPPSIVQMNNTIPDENTLPEGGWGLSLIQMLADRIEFSVQDGMNILQLGKRIAL